jgi:anti-repressor protein
MMATTASTDLARFDFDGQPVRVVTDDRGEPWFVATDVATVLDHRDAHSLTRLIPDDEKGTHPMRTLRGDQRVTVLSEPGLYRAILRSNSPHAEPFRRWVTHEVLPSIRRHGAYATPQTLEAMLADPDTMIRVLTELKAEQAKRRELETRVHDDAPKVLFADAVAASETDILVGVLAKILRANGVDIGQNRLFARLRDDGFLIRRRGSDWNAPTQRAMDLGVLTVKETVVAHADGHTEIKRTTKVTGKGQLYFVRYFLGKGSCAEAES